LAGGGEQHVAGGRAHDDEVDLLGPDTGPIERLARRAEGEIAGPSLSSTMCRSRIPVRWTIHSSEVSISFSSSAFVRTRCGA
jgi:hypothetical protein